MKIEIAMLCVLTAILPAGCGPASSQAGSDQPTRDSAKTSGPTREHAAATVVATMLKLAEDGNWGAYVDDFYGEAHKFRGPADRDAVVSRFQQQWGPKVVDALRRASRVSPTIDAEGRAVFADGGETLFMLYPHDDGRWTFHL